VNDIIDLLPKLLSEAGTTLWIVCASLFFGGIAGTLVGLALFLTRKGALFDQPVVQGVLNVVVNIFRPIPFIIFIAAIQPLSRIVIGTGIGDNAMIFAASIAATFGTSRIVEQNLVSISPGVIEAARAMGASRFRIVWSVIIPEALGPLILGYTFVFVALVDMAAVAGTIGGKGLGTFALQYGFKQFNPLVTWAAVIAIIIIVQLAQALGNLLARKVMRR